MKQIDDALTALQGMLPEGWKITTFWFTENPQGRAPRVFFAARPALLGRLHSVSADADDVETALTSLLGKIAYEEERWTERTGKPFPRTMRTQHEEKTG